MDNINSIVVSNLKDIRSQNKLSLDKLSDLTGVSKSMLGQIERGESSPTLQTVWKIASGLKISLTSLIVSNKSFTELIDKSKISPITEDDGRFKIYPMFPFDYEKRFEILTIEMDPGALSVSDPHGENTEEYIVMEEGELLLIIDGDEYKVSKGNAIRFRSDKTHEYHNKGGERAKFSMVIYYPHSVKEEI